MRRNKSEIKSRKLQRKVNGKPKPKLRTLCAQGHVGPWRFENSLKGVRRTCTACGWSVTEVGRNVEVTKEDKEAEKAAKKEKNREYNKMKSEAKKDQLEVLI